MSANMINKPDIGKSSSSAVFENLDYPNAGPLEVNQPNPNLIGLSDSLRSDDRFIENGMNLLTPY